MNTDQSPTHDHQFDELYATDGGGSDADDLYPHLTEYQVQRLQEFIDEAEFAYEENPVEVWQPGDTDAGERVGKAEKAIFNFTNLMLAERDAEIGRLKQAAGASAKFDVVYDPLNKRYDIVVSLPSNRQVRKPILNGCIDVRQQQTTLDVKHRDIAVRQLKDLIAYYQGLLAYVESKS